MVETFLEVVGQWLLAGFILFALLGAIFGGSSKKKRGPLAGSHTVEAMLFEGDPIKTAAARKVRDKFF